jgi:nitrous oxide reductase accessory protein NosL
MRSNRSLLRARFFTALLLALVCSLTPPALAASAAVSAPPRPGAADRCPVCGMFVRDNPQWVAAAVWRDGTFFYFDGATDLFRLLLHPERYRKDARRGDIAGAFVTEYAATTFVPAREVLYVYGSDVLGPMGPDLVPIRGAEKAAAFLREHAGRRVLRFDEITDALFPPQP